MLKKSKIKYKTNAGKNIFSAFFLPYIIYGALRKDLETNGEISEKARRGKEKVMLQKCYKTQKPLEKKSRLLYYNRTGLSMGVTRPNSPENN